MKKKLGFTLAEVLVTLTVIGVTAMLVLPLLKGGVDEKTLENQRKVAKQKLLEGFRTMQTKGELMKEYDSTEAFVETMKKYFNIAKVCSSDKLSGCFGDKIRKSKSEVLLELKNVRTSDQMNVNFAKKSNVIGLVFGDGVKALIAYNTDCIMTNRYDAPKELADVMECFAMYYNVSSDRSLNIVGEDIIAVNISDGTGSGTNSDCVRSYPEYSTSCPCDMHFYSWTCRPDSECGGYITSDGYCYQYSSDSGEGYNYYNNGCRSGECFVPRYNSCIECYFCVSIGGWIDSQNYCQVSW